MFFSQLNACVESACLAGLCLPVTSWSLAWAFPAPSMWGVHGHTPVLQPILSTCELWSHSSKAGMCSTLQKSRHLSTYTGNSPSKPSCWTCSLTYRRLLMRKCLLFSSPFSAHGNCQAPLSFLPLPLEEKKQRNSFSPIVQGKAYSRYLLDRTDPKPSRQGTLT